MGDSCATVGRIIRFETRVKSKQICGFISLDGGKQVPEIVCDVANFLGLADRSTVVLTDDVDAGYMLSSVPPPPFHNLTTHDEVLKHMVWDGVLLLQDCFPSDVPEWLSYGVCAFRFGHNSQAVKKYVQLYH